MGPIYRTELLYHFLDALAIAVLVIHALMASFRRKKEALRAVTYAFVAGVHYISTEVVRNLALRSEMGGGENQLSSNDVLNNYQNIFSSPQALDLFAEHLNEEGLYPFGSEWSIEVISELVGKLNPPSLLEIQGEAAVIRFKKGYKALLDSCADTMESVRRNDELLDHWLTLLLNTSFFGAMSVAARCSSNPKLYYSVLNEIETEIEPWSHYDQLVNLLDRQLRRETKRKTGLVTEHEFEQ